MVRFNLRSRLSSRLARRPAEPEFTTTVHLALGRGDDLVYQLDTPVEITEDEFGPYVVIGAFLRELSEPVTFDRIEIDVRHRRKR